ncbi:MAG: hypothetical protein AB1405_14525 [Bdellovibrionota bacterium]
MRKYRSENAEEQGVIASMMPHHFTDAPHGASLFTTSPSSCSGFSGFGSDDLIMTAIKRVSCISESYQKIIPDPEDKPIAMTTMEDNTKSETSDKWRDFEAALLGHSRREGTLPHVKSGWVVNRSLRQIRERTGIHVYPRVLEMSTRLMGCRVFLSEKDYLDDVIRLYEVPNEAEVKSFLQYNDYLVSLLNDAWFSVNDYFGFSSHIRLEVMTDPEAEGNSKLVMFILTPMPIEQALTALDAFDAAWWLDSLPRARGKLVVTLG